MLKIIKFKQMKKNRIRKSQNKKKLSKKKKIYNIMKYKKEFKKKIIQQQNCKIKNLNNNLKMKVQIHKK